MACPSVCFVDFSASNALVWRERLSLFPEIFSELFLSVKYASVSPPGPHSFVSFLSIDVSPGV